MKKNKKSKKKIIIISLISVIMLGVIIFFIFQNFTKKDFKEYPFHKGEDGFDRKENFHTINETIQKEITSFFESSPSSSEIEDYCNENPLYCMNYCIEINPNNEICSQMKPPMQEENKK